MCLRQTMLEVVEQSHGGGTKVWHMGRRIICRRDQCLRKCSHASTSTCQHCLFNFETPRAFANVSPWLLPRQHLHQQYIPHPANKTAGLGCVKALSNFGTPMRKRHQIPVASSSWG